MIRKGLARPKTMVAIYVGAIILICVMNYLMPRSFMSQEDQGYFTVELALPEGATIERSREVTERAIAYLKEDPDVRYVLNVTGSSPRVGTNPAHAQLTVILKPWDERETEDITVVRERIRDHLAGYPESEVLSLPLPSYRVSVHPAALRWYSRRRGMRRIRICNRQSTH